MIEKGLVQVTEQKVDGQTPVVKEKKEEVIKGGQQQQQATKTEQKSSQDFPKRFTSQQIQQTRVIQFML